MNPHKEIPKTTGSLREKAQNHSRNQIVSHLLFAMIGLSALLWFFVRVVPRPSRASYPCMRASMPLATGFIIWLTGLLGSSALIVRGKILLRARRRLTAGICLLLGVVAGAALLLGQPDNLVRAEQQAPNDPIGVASGVHPGRVVWIHDANATDWLGPGDGHWWEPEHTDYAVVEEMVSLTLRRLSGINDESATWDAFFRYFNTTRGRGNVGYTPGEKIVIKVNYVGCHALTGGVDPVSYNLTGKRDYPNTSPQVILAVLRQLVNVVGVNEEDISVGDPQTRFPNEFYDVFHTEFPDIHYLDYYGGNAQNPRTGVQYSTVPFYWSCHPTGTTQDHVPQSYADATYLINIANFKAHNGAGITLCAKNHYGSLIRMPYASGYYDMHTSLAAITAANGIYRAHVDLMGHAHMGGKSVLLLVDGLYAGVHNAYDYPRQWNCEPFNGDWTSSIFASLDPVALESVCFDLMQLDDDPNQYPHIAGVDDYLHEAALADNPPSGTFYDPNHDGDIESLTSLGVHEHWNNSTERLYSRNLGTGEGIELIRLDPATSVGPTTSAQFLTSYVYPNPFNPATRIHFELPQASHVELEVFSASGERVATLLRQTLPAGGHDVLWEGTNTSGQPVASGAYYYRLSAGSRRASGRMILLK
jgi:hypothetical protein